MSSGDTQLMVTEERVEKEVKLRGGDGGGSVGMNYDHYFSCYNSNCDSPTTRIVSALSVLCIALTTPLHSTVVPL